MKNVEIFKIVYLKKKIIMCRENGSDLFPAHFIPLILFSNLLPSMMMGSQAHADRSPGIF